MVSSCTDDGANRSGGDVGSGGGDFHSDGGDMEGRLQYGKRRIESMMRAHKKNIFTGDQATVNGHGVTSSRSVKCGRNG